MFDLFRSREKSVKILLGVMLLLVAAAMLVYLIPTGTGGFAGTEDNPVLATVGDQKVTEVELRRQLANLTQGQGNLPKGILAMYVPQMVEQQVQLKAMAYKAKEMGLRVSDEELGEAIRSRYAPQMGGTFNPTLYKTYIQQQLGMTVGEFEDEQRDLMLAQRLDSMERQSIVVSDADARAEYQRKNLKVGLQYVAFNKSEFMGKVSADPAAIKSYFDKNRGLFQIPEKRSYELVVGAESDFIQSAQVPQAELQKEYQESIDSFRTPERVRVRHILIKTQGKPKEEAPLLRGKAEQILKQLQGGGNFGEIAKKVSDDPGSAEKGGELGWVTRGQMVPNFEKACFSQKPGELGGIVETEYGYHIVQVEERQEAHTQTFEEALPQLLLEAKKQVAHENLRKNMDAARAEVAQHPKDTAAIVAKYGLKYFKQDNAALGTPLPDMPTNAALAGAVRTATKGTITEVFPLEKEGKSGFASITEVVPGHNAEFAEVEADAKQRYTMTEAERLAGAAANDAAAAVKKGESLEAAAKQFGGTVKTAAPFTADGAAEGIGSGVQLAAAFKSNVGDILGPITTANGSFVCKVSDKIPADMNLYAGAKKAIVDGLEQNKLQVQSPLFRDSIVSDLKRRGKIKMNDAAIAHFLERFQG